MKVNVPLTASTRARQPDVALSQALRHHARIDTHTIVGHIELTRAIRDRERDRGPIGL